MSDMVRGCRVALTACLRWLLTGMMGLGLCFGPMLLVWFQVAQPNEWLGEDSDEQAPLAQPVRGDHPSVHHPAAPLTALEEAAWAQLLRQLTNGLLDT
jgi:hypothetical protein